MSKKKPGKRPGRVGSAPDPELVERPRRRTFTAAYNLAIVREADACTETGEVGALLRREGLYSSHLVDWRRQRDAGALEALSKRRGRRSTSPSTAEIERLRRRAERAEAELEKARKVQAQAINTSISNRFFIVQSPCWAGGHKPTTVTFERIGSGWA